MCGETLCPIILYFSQWFTRCPCDRLHADSSAAWCPPCEPASAASVSSDDTPWGDGHPCLIHNTLCSRFYSGLLQQQPPKNRILVSTECVRVCMYVWCVQRWCMRVCYGYFCAGSYIGCLYVFMKPPAPSRQPVCTGSPVTTGGGAELSRTLSMREAIIRAHYN